MFGWKFFYVGRPVMGIPIYIGLDWILFALLWLFISGLFGIGAYLTIMSIILAHEYFHCIAGRYYGCSIERINMTCMGGMAMFKELPRNPYHELVVAVAGPMLNVLLIPVLYFLPSNPFTHLVQIINLYILGFNMLPLAVSDGGRVFRSILMIFNGDRVYSTHISVKFGQCFAITLGLGMTYYNGFPNPMLILILFMLCYMSQIELKNHRIQLIKRLTNKTKVFGLSEDELNAKMTRDKDFARRVKRLIQEKKRLSKILDFDFTNKYPIRDRFSAFDIPKKAEA